MDQDCITYNNKIQEQEESIRTSDVAGSLSYMVSWHQMYKC